MIANRIFVRRCFHACTLAVLVSASLLARAQAEQPPRESELPMPAQKARSQVPTAEELKRWFSPLDTIKISTKPPAGAIPLDTSEHLFKQAELATPTVELSRAWAASELNWAASEIYAWPTYWDEVPLERYGQNYGPVAQPFVSGAHFFTNFVIMPYKLGIDGTFDQIYTLGYYRIGDPAPQVRQRLPGSPEGAIFESTVWIAAFLLLP